MNLFYFHVQSAGEAVLLEEEARHCIRVLRKKKGDDLFGVDGKGNMYKSRITGLGKNRVELKLIEKYDNWGEHPYEIVLGISVLRQADRMEWVIEKAVELGATRIQPLISKRTVKPGVRMARLQKILISAMKQCKRSRLPELNEPIALADFIEEPFEGISIVGWCEEESPLEKIADSLKGDQPIRLLIGPEGGFSQEEVEAAKDCGFQSVLLGENRLRAESAAIYLLSIVKFLKSY